jgi:restriction system protein
VLFDTETIAPIGRAGDPFSFVAQELTRELPSIRPVDRLYASQVQNAPVAIEHLHVVNEELLDALRSSPHLLTQLTARRFEEVVAAIWQRLGYDIVLTPRSRDGGKDIYAVRHSEVGNLLYVIECKRYAPNRPVGVEIVRSLYGVAQQERASMGIVATTSTFTKGAMEFQSKVPYQLSLHDYRSLGRWLENIDTRNDRLAGGGK